MSIAPEEVVAFWREAGPPLEPTTHSPNASIPFEEPISLVDLDGDGLVDMVKAEAPDAAIPDDDWHWFYRHNVGGAFGPKIPLDVHGAPLQSATTGHTFMFPLDLAGDGLRGLGRLSGLGAEPERHHRRVP